MDLKDKLKRLSDTDGVTGNEYQVSQVVSEFLTPYMDQVTIDRFGNVSGFKSCHRQNAKSILLDAHIDQIGFRVTQITEQGFLRFNDIGVDPRMLPGAEINVLTQSGPIPGIICTLPPHMQKKGENKQAIPMNRMLVDIGANNGAEARKMVRLGDYMVFRMKAFDLMGDMFCGRAMDDRACFCCILYAMELLESVLLPIDVYVSGSTKEEIGGHGGQAAAYRINPDYAIVLDVTHARTEDSPEISVKLGDGAVISTGPNSRPEFAAFAEEIALAKRIPFVRHSAPENTGTHARTIQLQRNGISTLLISLPLKYMHSPVEVLRMSDIQACGNLLAEILKAMEGRKFA